MIATLDIHEHHVRILRDVLRAHLPPGVHVCIFGSRAHGGARRYSDLDLALEWAQPLDLGVIGRIAEALSESDLPYKVDLVDLALVDPGFRARVLGHCIPIDIGLREAGDPATLGAEASTEPGG
jgi:predicted nucleotidyltransferase